MVSHPYCHVITLGTAGGPRWWHRNGARRERAGISTAVVVGGATYLVDAGTGAGRQLERAGLTVDSLRAVFLTHLHSDHTVDLASLALFGMYQVPGQRDPLRILGPGNRGVLPPVSPLATRPPEPVFAHAPTPGTREMVDLLLRAHATDLNDRVLDGLRPSPRDFLRAEDIAIPQELGYHPNANPTPDVMAPFEIYRDEIVTVTATLVQHPPIAPAFAFRFDTDQGSVTISGDTAPCENLVRLAQDTDLLLHEALDFDRIERVYAGQDDETARASMDHHRKSHTSPTQALELARRARARRLALHHLVPGSTPDAAWRAFGAHLGERFVVPDDLERISFSREPLPGEAGADPRLTAGAR